MRVECLADPMILLPETPMVFTRVFVFASIMLVWMGNGVTEGQEVYADSVFESYDRYTEASALLEKTIFRLDVALLTLRLGPETTFELENLARAQGGGAIDEDELVEVAIRTRGSSARLQFLRDLGFDRFLDGIRNGLDAAKKAGWVDQEFAFSLSANFPLFYSSLRERGVKEGDTMFYFIRGDTLRTVFRTMDGETVVDQTDVGSMAVLSVMGGFLSPESDFHDKLLESLVQAVLPDSARAGDGPEG